MGTVNNKRENFYKNCLEALKGTPYQVIISVGKNINISALGDIPENITVLPSVDQIAVLKKADVFLSHCGMNSVSESLYFEVPLVMFPQTPEQDGVARRVEQFCAGEYLRKNEKKEILSTLQLVLDNSSYKKAAVKISHDFKKCGGAEAAAQAILKAADL